MSAPVGGLATEAALLLEAIAARLEALRPDAGAQESAPGTAVPAARAAASDGDAAGGPCPQCGHDPSAGVTCTACPLCRLLAVLRGERPETTARLVEGAVTVVQALRALLPGPAAPDTPGTPAAPGATGAPDTPDTPGAPGAPAAPGPGAADREGAATVGDAVRADRRTGDSTPESARPAGIERIIVR